MFVLPPRAPSPAEPPADAERRRRHRRWLAWSAAASALLVLLSNVAAYAADRFGQVARVDTLHRACQAAYTAEAARTLHVEQLPTTLGAPFIDVSGGGDARFRVYSAPPGPLRSMTFDCSRTAGGVVTGRLAYGMTSRSEVPQPVAAYRDWLPDGTVVVVARLRDPHVEVQMTVTGGALKYSRHDDLVVLWGERSALTTAKLTADGATLDLARDDLTVTATYQEEEFAAYCQRHLDRQPALSGATLRTTASYGNSEVVRVYRSAHGFALCSWAARSGDPAKGISYRSPVLDLSSADGTGVGMTLSSSWPGGGSWIVGPVPAHTERVAVVGSDGTVVQAQLGDGVYVAQGVDFDKATKIVITTATTVYTLADAEFTQRPR
ncbi:hypothetical protein [Catellatospora sp. TT07R-123]|uniref:hypothetical protein n=1 Tax=Catellatospora sp. TT07R-123 TaxID=2733863 RepID=UPI001BB3704C|nr:hypothetical protein [Catellatospora sp. TT07R-123]